jgi:hypothetical protein
MGAVLGWIASGLASFAVGLIYEKQTSKELVTSTDSKISLGWWDKTLLVILGLGAFYIIKKVK